MKQRTKGQLIKGTAIAIDTLPPLAATMTQFPIWVERSGAATVSGLFIIFACISCIPFLKQIKEYMKSPSIWVVWVIIFGGLIALRAIIDEMCIIAAIGLVSNVIGSWLYKIGNIVEKKPE